MDGLGFLINEESPQKLCIGAIASFKLLIDRMWQASFDGNTDVLHDTVRCPDVGVHRGGWGGNNHDSVRCFKEKRGERKLSMDLFQVNQETCNQDGICAADCPAGLIDFQKGGYPKPIPEAEKLCIRCGHCVVICPTGSLSHREMPMEQCPTIKKDLQLTAEHYEHFLRNRRSIRVYKDKTIPQDELTRLIEIARYAPSGRNCQCVEWLVLNNRDELQNLKGLIGDWMSTIPDTLMKWEFGRWKAGQDVILRNAPVVIVTHAEKANRFAPPACTIALSYLDLTATTMGLGCCWAGFFMSAATLYPPFIEALSLPEGHQCFGAMMVGYPRFSYHRLPLRKAPPITWRSS